MNDNTSQGQQCNYILNNNDFIAGANNPPGQMVRWVDLIFNFKANSEMINNGNNTNESNVASLSTLKGKN